ncbi:MAG: hypothetical protein OEZ09_07350 [Betaproteobacteria bacterium]|nr:hypothetical protein [Betaproteobacteria bacterium]
MPRVEPLDLTFSPRAKTRVCEFLASITDYPPTLTLKKGWTNNDPELRWTYGAYGPDNIAHVAPDVERCGYALLYAVEDLTVAIPQFQYLAELEGKMFDLGRNELVLVDRVGGI